MSAQPQTEPLTQRLVFVMADGSRLTVHKGDTLTLHVRRGPAIAVSQVERVEVVRPK